MSLKLFEQVEIREAAIKLCLAANSSFFVRWQGQVGDVYYDNRWAVSDLDVFFAHERTDYIVDTATFKLDKPLCVIYSRETKMETGTVDTGLLHVEFMIAVNYEPDGPLNLRGYISLLQALLNPRKSKGVWLPYGLAIRRAQEGPIYNGSELYESLANRILIQSVVGTFTTISEE